MKKTCTVARGTVPSCGWACAYHTIVAFVLSLLVYTLVSNPAFLADVPILGKPFGTFLVGEVFLPIVVFAVYMVNFTCILERAKQAPTSAFAKTLLHLLEIRPETKSKQEE